MKNKKIITFKEASKNATDCLYYPDGVYQYQIKGVYHLIIDGKDVLDGLNADNCYYYTESVYKYQINGVWCLGYK